ncbi:MAG: FG-GAP-like repeat-containing protein [Bacteroidota bacterium]
MRYSSLLLLFTLCGALTAQRAFTEVSAEAGINHTYRVDLATFGGGAAVIDFDNDGWEDIYLTGGLQSDALYRNLGNGQFEDVFEGSGLEITDDFYTIGVSAADIDRDGDKDLLVTTFSDLTVDRNRAHNLLFINMGNGTFSEQSAKWGLQDYRVNSCSATFGDVNNDGFPDLFVSNYYSTTGTRVNIYNEQTITNSFTPTQPYLFLNTGGTAFVEVGELYGILDDGFGFQGLFTDYDVDGDLDILLANDFGFRRTPNRLYRNDFPERSYTDRSLQAALNYGMNAMGIAMADYNFDGLPDYYITNLGTSVFSVNQGPGAPFADFTVFSGIILPEISDSLYTGLPISWGANFFDFDNDLDQDLFVCNGALNPTIRLNPNLFYVCDEELKYNQVAEDMGLYHYGIGRGSVTFDYDKDGDLDLFVVNQFPRDFTTLGGTLPPPRSLLYRNENNEGNWLQIALKGKRSTTFGLGSSVKVYVDGQVLLREIDGGSSHLSQNSTIAHFGIGDATSVDSVVVQWIGGSAQTITNVPINRFIAIEQTEERGRSSERDILRAFPTSFQDELFIEYQLSTDNPVNISIYNVSGQRMATILEAASAPIGGIQRWTPDVSLPNGIYYLVMEHAGNTTVVPVSSIKR